MDCNGCGNGVRRPIISGFLFVGGDDIASDLSMISKMTRLRWPVFVIPFITATLVMFDGFVLDSVFRFRMHNNDHTDFCFLFRLFFVTFDDDLKWLVWLMYRWFFVLSSSSRVF